MALFTTARVSRSITGAINGAYRSGEMSAKSATARRYQLPDGRPGTEEPGHHCRTVRKYPWRTAGDRGQWDINGTVILGWHEPDTDWASSAAGDFKLARAQTMSSGPPDGPTTQNNVSGRRH
jgi:hypothetical protein